ncbi:heme A synthase, partial [Acinetobacter baumannii]|nr:heme A synthase [Acinetobacter baumannii]
MTSTSHAPTSGTPAASAPGRSTGPLSRLPMPSMRVQKGIALANVIAQIGIMTTGVTVRVTASGLGCETWPRCNQDSFVPVPG